jgi:hypothetical protein
MVWSAASQFLSLPTFAATAAPHACPLFVDLQTHVPVIVGPFIVIQ